jgi:hypothetical protein
MEGALSSLKRASRTRVSPGLLGEALEIYASMPSEDRPAFEARAFRPFEMLNDKGFSDRRLSDLAVAINLRLTALAQLVKGDYVRGWTLVGQDNRSTWLHVYVLKAAVIEPLIEDANGEVAFDAANFARRLMTLTKVEGRA